MRTAIVLVVGLSAITYGCYSLYINKITLVKPQIFKYKHFFINNSFITLRGKQARNVSLLVIGLGIIALVNFLILTH